MEDNPYTSRFVIVDNYEISGGGIILSSEIQIGGGNITEDLSLLKREDRILAKHQHGKVLWFTGLSGSGKSTIGDMLEKELNSNGYSAYRIDGDNLRMGLNKDCDFTENGRRENLRRAGEVARLFADAGMIAICTLFLRQSQQEVCCVI